MFKLQRTRIQNTHFALYISDTPVTLKQSQGYQIYNDDVDPKQGYNHAKFGRSCFHGVRERANVKSFSTKKICQLPPLNMSENQK